MAKPNLPPIYDGCSDVTFQLITDLRLRVRELDKEYKDALASRDGWENDYYRVLEKLSDEDREAEITGGTTEEEHDEEG